MKFQDLSIRLVFSCIILLTFAVLLFFAYDPYVNCLLALLLSFLGGIGMWEYCFLVKIGKQRKYSLLVISFGVLLIASFFLSSLAPRFHLLPFFLLFLSVFFLFLYHFDKISGASSSIALGFFCLCYVAIPMGLLFAILYFPFLGRGEGRFWILYLVVVTKITDVGAYFGGRLLGKRKLAAELSPGKTVVGAVIGFLSAIVFSFLLYIIQIFFRNISFSLVESLWLGALLGSFGQVGDLAESLLKRDAEVKDSNRLPGLGGVLDMFDSLFFTAPVLYFFLYM